MKETIKRLGFVTLCFASLIFVGMIYDGGLHPSGVLANTGHPVLHRRVPEPAPRPGTDERMAQLEPTPRSSPVKITAVDLDGSPMAMGDVFHADNGWLKRTTVTVWNRSTKKIVAAEIRLDLPDTGNGVNEPRLVYPATFGIIPNGSVAGEPLTIAPGQSANLRISLMYSDLQSWLARFGFDGPAS